MFKWKRYSVSLLGCLSVAAVALSTALSTRAEAQGDCGGDLNITRSPAGAAAVTDVRTITIIMGAGIITGGPDNTLTINRVRYQLDCDQSFPVGVPCVDQGDIFSYLGDATITTNCPGVDFSSNVPLGGFATNQIVFTPTLPIVIPANAHNFCQLSFNVQLDYLEPLPPDPASDFTPAVVEVAAGYSFPTTDAACDNGGPSGTSQSSQIPIAGCGTARIDPGSGETCDPPGSIPTTPVGNTNPCTATCTYCGDGIVQPGEACDTAGPSATCSAACVVLPICGDSLINAPGETCDPPGSTPLVPAGNQNTCRGDCTYCGDGVIQTPEACDTAGPSSTCTATCTPPPPACGDGIVNPLNGETCDPPGSIPNPVFPQNVCRANCTYCGDGTANGNETCDVANPTCLNGGFCRADCLRCIRNDPAIIRFKEGNDRFWLHGRWEDMGENLDPSTVVVSIHLTNANGEFYATNLNVGDVEKVASNSRRTIYRYKNKDAKANGGIKSFKLIHSGAWYRVTVVAFGDLSGATLEEMRAEVAIGVGAGYANSGKWKHIPRNCSGARCKGWIIQK